MSNSRGSVLLVGHHDILRARRDFARRLRTYGWDIEFGVVSNASWRKDTPGTRNSGITLMGQKLTSPDELSAYSIVHSFDTRPNLFVGQARNRLNSRSHHIATITGRGQAFSGALGRYEAPKRTYNRLFESALRNTDQVVFQNERDERHYFNMGLIGPRTQTNLIAGSGVSETAFAGISDAERALAKEHFRLPAEKIIVGSAGRPLRSKNIGSIATVLDRLGTRYHGLHAGEVPNRATLRTEGHRNLQDLSAGRLQFAGQLNDMRQFFAAIDIFCFASDYFEGLPRVVLEASAAGCYVVATDAPGCAEALPYCGTMAKSSSPSDIFEATSSVTGSDIARARMENPKFVTTAGLDSHAVAKSYADLYEDTLR